MQAYYCKNEADLRKVSLHILQSEYQECIEEQLELAFVCGCNCNLTDDIPERFCGTCSEDDESIDGRCLLCESIEKKEKNTEKNIVLSNETDNIEYPCVVIIADAEVGKSIRTIMSINTLKENTKYGCN